MPGNTQTAVNDIETMAVSCYSNNMTSPIGGLVHGCRTFLLIVH